MIKRQFINRIKVKEEKSTTTQHRVECILRKVIVFKVYNKIGYTKIFVVNV